MTSSVDRPAGLDHSRLTRLVGYVASRAAIELRKDFARELGPLGLKVLDYSILVLVAANAEVNQKRLGEALDVSAPGVEVGDGPDSAGG